MNIWIDINHIAQYCFYKQFILRVASEGHTVFLTVLNRADSNNKCFPNTIKEVIFEESKGVYQFSSVIPGGRWWRVEPNEECWEAVNIVNGMKDDITFGALYFEACSGESWHSKNLEFLFKSDNTRFYK